MLESMGDPDEELEDVNIGECSKTEILDIERLVNLCLQNTYLGSPFAPDRPSIADDDDDA